ncbi:FGGY-family carbohydrate kinase [Oscillospiraceae bacterium PP1C4]
MEYLIGTDIGTSGTKTIIMDTKGRLISSDLQEYDIITPKALWAEQWPDIWVEATKRSIKNAREKANCDPADIKGICISGLYGGSGVPLDQEMKPVRPCLIWMDRRAGKQEEWVLDNIGKEKLYEITHNGTDPYYGYTKILWIKHNEPENWAKIKLFLPPNAYAIYKLTGDVAIDYSSAGNIGGIFDEEKRVWSEEMLQAMDIPVSMMPQRIVESSDIVGGLTAEVASELGLAQGTPVCAGGVDCVVATLGLGIFEPGSYAAAIGTSMCAAFVHDYPINAKGLIEMPYVKDAHRLSYSFGGGATAGALPKWFRDNFAQLEKQAEEQGGENAYKVLDREAAEIPAGSDGLVVLPYFMGERSPVWDTNARGNIFGLTLFHTKAHVYRAFLEAVAYSLRHTMESTNTNLGDYILVAGGAAKSSLWRQIIADVTGYPIICPVNDVEANLGDVILAGIGTGVLTYADVKDWQVLGEKVMPNKEAHERYNQYYNLYHSIYTHLKEDMAQAAQLSRG